MGCGGARGQHCDVVSVAVPIFKWYQSQMTPPEVVLGESFQYAVSMS